MRLLKYSDDEFKLTKDLVHGIPAYAILSHTWGEDTEEVNFKDLIDGTGQDKAGYEKIKFCVAQARRDGLLYVWVDTCCIDKSSNSELSEAINSMFRWYQNAARCYVYLSDVSVPNNEAEGPQSEVLWESAFRASRWFMRGWTLQELLAPVSVEFFTQTGQRLGDKKSLEQLINEITGINFSALRGSATMSTFDVEERFKWAEIRETTREEDWAYCLLGIFGVFMPLLYGEGKVNAVRRLRKEIADAIAHDDMSNVQDSVSPTWSPPSRPPTFQWGNTTQVSPLIASIMEVAAFGVRLSECIRDYGFIVVGAEKRLSGLDNDISFTSGILSELGTLLNDARVQALVSEHSIRLSRDAVAECDGIFQAMEGVIANIRKNGLGKLKMYFRETKIELLRSNLGRMKGNLTLLMGVIVQATQILLERPNETTLAIHRQKIRELMIEKEAYTQRYLIEKHKYDDLLAKVNSTSTLGSISTALSGNLIAESSNACVQATEYSSPIHVEELANEMTPNSSSSVRHNLSLNAQLSPRAELSSCNLELSPQDVQVGPRAALAATTLSQMHLSNISPSKSKGTQLRTSSRDQALNIARRVAKGAGYIIVVIVAVAFFPVTVIVLIIWRRQRKLSQRYQPDEPQPPCSLDSVYPSPQIYTGDQRAHQAYTPAVYASAGLSAELPALHELAGHYRPGNVEMGLVSELTHITPGYMNRYEIDH